MSKLKDKIKETYASIVDSGANQSCCSGSANKSCCNTAEITDGFSEDYSTLPGYHPDADYGLGCGMPIHYAQIKAGQTVLDLGCGAGNDVFVAHSLVGETGKVIGIDMTPSMIEKAKSNKIKLGLTNVEFILADIENMPIPNNSIDVIVSNCVLNMVSDKLKTYQDIYRVLRKGGHFSISDVVVSGKLSSKMESIVELYAGCVAGAMIKSDYLNAVESAGFENVEIKKEKTVPLSDDFLLPYLSQAELEDFRHSGIQILSITINGFKSPLP